MKVVATTRKEQGTSASRRLRHAKLVPGIIYGGKAQPAQISMEHNPLYHSMRVEAFHSSILDLELDGKSEKVLVRNVQWHAYKPQIMHVDFQRVAADQKIQIKVPLHFKGEEVSPAVKTGGALVSHVVTEVEVSCLPADLPEFIEVDLSKAEVGHAVHIGQVALPKGVTVVGKQDFVLATFNAPGAVVEEPAPVVAAAPAAAEPKKEEKKEPAKK